MARRTSAANQPRFPPPARLTVYPAGFTIRLVYSAFEKGACIKKTTIQYILALIACFVVGCGIALGLNAYDRHSERITPISGGQTVDFSAYGFTLTVPDDFSLNDYTTNNAAEGGNALFAGCVYGSLGELYLFCYANESGDSLRQHREQDVVTYYMNAGATDVRLRTLGGRRFICYRATVDREDGEETWDTYETWDGDIQLTFETRMSPGDVLPILATIAFTPIAQEN